jgi:hypothetical protein
MADHLGEPDLAAEYRAVFEKGKAWVDRNLFNGEYYSQKVNIKDKGVLKKYGAVEAYWDSEHKEIKYQIGEGCEIDQVLAQWHANLYGLGEIFDPKQTKQALRSIFKNNFKESMRDYFNSCRIFCINDEKGVVICDWPEGVRRPAIPIPYAQETMHGYEYAAAIQMIQTGLVKEGLAVVKAVRDRYDGCKRNPWNEIECGSNYARSMASYALLNAFSGFEFDMTKGLIGFDPIRLSNGKFGCFWSLDSGWGVFEMKRKQVELSVFYGELRLRILKLPRLAKTKVKSVSLNGKRIAFAQDSEEITFKTPVRIRQNRSLNIMHLPLTHRRRTSP